MEQNKILNLYQELRAKHGHPKGQWSLWCKRPKSVREREEVIIGAILTQNTNWQNVEKAVLNLRNAKCLSLKKINALPRLKLVKLIKPAGYYNIKAGYLKVIAAFFEENGGVKQARKHEITKSRNQFLHLRGVGQETADSILLYALDKPNFVIDAYTKRLVQQKKLVRKLTYEYLQALFEKNLRKDYRLYQNFHALIVIEGKFLNRKIY